MVRRSRSVSILVPITVPVRILTENPNRELYSIQNGDAANSVWVSPNREVTAAAGSYQGQEVVARGYVSDDMDQGEVWAVSAAAAGVRITVQETIFDDARGPSSFEKVTGQTQTKTAGRTPFRRESRVM